jgi:hypothetical protein
MKLGNGAMFRDSYTWGFIDVITLCGSLCASFWANDDLSRSFGP